MMAKGRPGGGEMMTKEEEFEAVKRIRQVLKDNPNVRMTQRYQTEKDRLKR